MTRKRANLPVSPHPPSPRVGVLCAGVRYLQPAGTCAADSRSIRQQHSHDHLLGNRTADCGV